MLKEQKHTIFLSDIFIILKEELQKRIFLIDIVYKSKRKIIEQFREM